MNGDLTTADLWDQTWTMPAMRSSRWRERLREAVHWKFDRMLCRLMDAAAKPQLDILELGCAPGTILERIHRLRPQHRLHGIDFAPDGCRLARERFRELGMTVSLHEGDARTLVLPRRYDLVLSCGLIEHFADPVEVLRCHARFATPGGLVAVTVPNFATSVVRFFLRHLSPEVFATHNLGIMNLRALAEALRAAGLEQVAAGHGGGPQLVSDVSCPALRGRLYRRAAQGWNLLVAPFPAAPWHAHLWALGRVPATALEEQS